jgi:hypothetical protein
MVRPANFDGYRLSAERQGDTTLVTLDALPYPGRFENSVRVLLDILPPGGTKKRVVMPLIAPGQYAVRVPTPSDAPYDFLATCEVDRRTVFTGRATACPGYPAEFVPREPNEVLLRELATATGGRFNPTPAELFPPDQAPSLQTHALWHYLLFAAVLVYLAELAVRRLVWHPARDTKRPHVHPFSQLFLNRSW